MTSHKTTLKMKIDRTKGTVRYWSVYGQQWTTQPLECVPDQELAAMPEKDRMRITTARDSVEKAR